MNEEFQESQQILKAIYYHWLAAWLADATDILAYTALVFSARMRARGSRSMLSPDCNERGHTTPRKDNTVHPLQQPQAKLFPHFICAFMPTKLHVVVEGRLPLRKHLFTNNYLHLEKNPGTRNSTYFTL